MIICWDNLENVYLTTRGTFRKGSDIYVIDICPLCKETFLRIKSKKNTFCSKRCANLGDNNPRYGKSMSKAHKLIISKANSGKSSYRYNPNLSDEDRIRNRDYTDYIDWRLKVYKKDNYNCKKCNDDKGGNLVAHHIMSYSAYPKYRLNVDNGITLCEKCHIKFHKYFGYGNNTKEQLAIFMNSKKDKEFEY